MSTKYTKEVLEEAVLNSKSYAGVIRWLGKPLAGGTHTHIKRQINKYGIDTSHFTGQGHNKGKVANNRKCAAEILIVLPEGNIRPKVEQLRRALAEMGVEQKCVGCGLGTEWMGKPITLEIDHKNGSWLDNRLENLRYLCPNCHSQEDTNKSWKSHLTSKSPPDNIET